MAGTSTKQEVATAGGLTPGLVLDVITGKVSGSHLVFTAADPAETARRIAERELGAESIDDLLGNNTVSGKEFVGRPFRLDSVEFMPSEFVNESGVNFYAVLYGTEPTGKKVTVTVGAVTVMRKVAIMAAKGWLPHWIKIVEGPATEKGYKPLDVADATEFAPFGDAA